VLEISCLQRLNVKLRRFARRFHKPQRLTRAAMQHRRIVTARHQHCGGITFLVAPRTYAIDSDAICADLVTWIRLRAERLSWLKDLGPLNPARNRRRASAPRRKRLGSRCGIGTRPSRPHTGEGPPKRRNVGANATSDSTVMNHTKAGERISRLCTRQQQGNRQSHRVLICVKSQPAERKHELPHLRRQCRANPDHNRRHEHCLPEVRRIRCIEFGHCDRTVAET